MGLKKSKQPQITQVEPKAVVPGAYLATYQRLPWFHFVKELRCYVEELDTLPGDLPPPHPPPAPKIQLVNSRQFTDIDHKVSKAPRNLKYQTYADLVGYLTDSHEDTLAKVRALYCWLTSQTIYDIKVPKKPPTKSEVMYRLWRIRTSRGNYAELFSDLCRFAGIVCVIIHGVLKGATYQAGDELDREKHYGEWNAVLIDGHWRLVNVFWGKAASEGASPGEMAYEYDENFFLVDPEQLIYSHLPEEPEWQLLKNPITEEQFEEMAFLKDNFFNFGMSLLSHKKCTVESPSGEIELKFGLRKDRVLNLDFRLMINHVTNRAPKHRCDEFGLLQILEDCVLSVTLRVPSAGDYFLDIVGRDTERKGTDYDWVAIYKIIFKKGASDFHPFPIQPAIGWGGGNVTLAYNLMPLTRGAVLEIHPDSLPVLKFRFLNGIKNESITFKACLMSTGDETKSLHDHVIYRKIKNEIIFNFEVPQKGLYTLHFFVNDERKSNGFDNFCNYLVNCKDDPCYNGAYPAGFHEGLGVKPVAQTMGLKLLSHDSSYIHTRDDRVRIDFEKTKDVSLTISLTGKGILRGAAQNHLVSKEEGTSTITYWLTLPTVGKCGFRIQGTDRDGYPYRTIFAFIIDYRITCIHYEEYGGEIWGSNQGVTRRVMPASAVGNNRAEVNQHAINAGGDQNLHVQPEQYRKEISEAAGRYDGRRIECLLDEIDGSGYGKYLQEEVSRAKTILSRLVALRETTREVEQLDQRAIAEIRDLKKPPPEVHRVMAASFLLIGYNESETEVWSDNQLLIGKTGESIRKKILNLDISSVPIGVAREARDMLRHYTEEQIHRCCVSAVVFFVWVRSVVEEVENRFEESRMVKNTGLT
ncbi:hypothetical protein ScPMuIL_007811 [Solemya velum]